MGKQRRPASRWSGLLIAGCLALTTAACTPAETSEPETGAATQTLPAPSPLPGPSLSDSSAPSSPSVSPSSRPSAPPSPSAGGGITVSLNALRLNIGERIISIRVFNGTAAPVSITAAKLATPLFHGTAFWTPGPSGSSVLRPGATVALPVPLTAARCGQAAADPKVFLTLDETEHQFPATDPHEVLSSLQHHDCLRQAVHEVAELSLPREVDVAPDQRTAVVRLSVAPTGHGGDVELNSIRGTTLLAENPERPWPRELSIAGTDSASVVEVSVLPARCDPHALAEDKAGTRLPVDITAGEWSGQLLLEPDEEFTRSVYAFVTAACAKEGSTESANRGK